MPSIYLVLSLCVWVCGECVFDYFENDRFHHLVTKPGCQKISFKVVQTRYFDEMYVSLTYNVKELVLICCRGIGCGPF